MTRFTPSSSASLKLKVCRYEIEHTPLVFSDACLGSPLHADFAVLGQGEELGRQRLKGYFLNAILFLTLPSWHRGQSKPQRLRGCVPRSTSLISPDPARRAPEGRAIDPPPPQPLPPGNAVDPRKFRASSQPEENQRPAPGRVVGRRNDGSRRKISGRASPRAPRPGRPALHAHPSSRRGRRSFQSREAGEPAPGKRTPRRGALCRERRLDHHDLRDLPRRPR